MQKKIELGKVPKEPTWIPNAYGDWVPEAKVDDKSWGTNLGEPRKQWVNNHKEVNKHGRD